jgi:plasmid segregation protein ParM
MLNSGIISVDDGGSSTCVVTKSRRENFPSIKGVYGNRNFTDVNGKYDFVVDYKNEKFVMGTLAKYDCRVPLQMHTDSKQNLFFDLSVLVAIHQFGYSNNYLVASVPIAMHSEKEKAGRISRLKGEHTITVNGYTKTFHIMDVKVAPESAVAFWIKEPKGKTRFIDLGSRTIGYATCLYEDGITRFIDSESGTFKGMGLEALGKDYDHISLADFICGRLLSNWGENDTIHLLGGGALNPELVASIGRYFPKTVVLDNPQMANAFGMYLLGRTVFDMA